MLHFLLFRWWIYPIPHHSSYPKLRLASVALYFLWMGQLPLWFVLFAVLRDILIFIGAGYVKLRHSVVVARLVQPLTDFLAEAKFGYNEIDANRNEIADGVREKVAPIFLTLGFELKDFRVENTDFDDDTRRRVARIADMQAEAHAAQAVGLNFAQVQQLAALRDAAQNQGGVAGMGVGLGAGVGMGQAMAGMMTNMNAPQTPAATEDPVAKLAKLKQMLDNDLITRQEYDTKKQQILSQL